MEQENCPTVSRLDDDGISLAGQDLEAVPAAVWQEYGHVKKLDLSYNALT